MPAAFRGSTRLSDEDAECISAEDARQDVFHFVIGGWLHGVDAAQRKRWTRRYRGIPGGIPQTQEGDGKFL